MKTSNPVGERSKSDILARLLFEAAELAAAEGLSASSVDEVSVIAGTYLRIETKTYEMDTPSLVTEWVTLNRRHQVARSMKIYNILIDPMSALRNAISGAREAATAAAGTAIYSQATNLPSTGLAQYLAAPLACLAFILAAHFGRRRDIAYEHGCLLALAWSVSEYIDGKFVVVEDDLMAALDAMPGFGVHDFNEEKARTGLSRLEAWKVVERHGPAYTLLERISIKGS